MKLPVIKHLQRNNEVEKLENTIEVLENFTEHRSVSDEEMDVIGELLTNLCGAVEVHKMIENGDSEMDAANNFVKKVLGSIDK
ncbi:hypothetical protein RM545_04805 [Zunongwangia sp. F260]|jgi:hypothetical protein|uniref:NTP pyrophosphohydrolase MazG putative catalytic core domain-containing protein n=2 Tax=Autumnicola TaxID=3160927 RepID=A0ABU3CZ60_9FLAO|nr:MULTISPECIES: hypothetical protein [unclassified Zunongwangia]MDT0646001.1 hypothetical protein [Zunongwangia sp. F260]MDT0651645.1 hypothetical protein [Zunongwangia sp. F297]